MIEYSPPEQPPMREAELLEFLLEGVERHERPLLDAIKKNLEKHRENTDDAIPDILLALFIIEAMKKDPLGDVCRMLGSYANDLHAMLGGDENWRIGRAN